MIELPDRASEPYRYFGIDNGTKYMGVSVCETDLVTLKMRVSYCTTLDAERLVYRYGDIEDSHSPLHARLRVLEDILLEMMRKWEPHGVAVERPFSHLNPRTFAELTESMYVTRRVTQSYDSRVCFYRYSPMTGKKAVLASDYSDKETTREAIYDLVKSGEIILDAGINLDELGDDGIDSISIGYVHHLETKRVMQKCNGFPFLGWF